MEYRSIKNLNPGSEMYNHLWEMAKDGKSVRLISDPKIVREIKDEKVFLFDDKKNEKKFGAKTLYRKSWGKALPSSNDNKKSIKKSLKKEEKVKTPSSSPKKLSKTALKKLERQKARELREKIKKEKEAIKKEKKKRKELKNSFKLKKGQLITKFSLDTLKENEKYALKKGNHFIEFVGKNTFIKVILRKNGLWLMRIDGKSEWRNGYWFFNPENKKYEAFSDEKHRKGYGNDNIIWPSL